MPAGICAMPAGATCATAFNAIVARKHPSTNIQAPEKIQTPSSNPLLGAFWVLVAWDFSGAWCLEFGVFISLLVFARLGHGGHNSLADRVHFVGADGVTGVAPTVAH